MKQNSVCLYVKQNNNNSEGLDGNEQCKKEAPNLKWTKCNSITKLENWTTYLRYGFFFPNSECSRYIPDMQKQLSH